MIRRQLATAFVGSLVMVMVGACDNQSVNVGIPETPTGVMARAGDRQITLSWNDVKGADSYTIYWSQSSGVGPDNGNSLAEMVSPFVHKPLVNGSLYFYVVAAVNDRGESEPSAEVGATPQPAPGAPLSIRVDAGDGENTIVWAPVTGASSYNLYWSETPGVTKDSDAIVDVESPYVHSGLTNEQPYYYAVSGQNNFGEGPLSPEATGTPFSSSNPPHPPTELVATAGDGEVILAWTVGLGATTYNAYYSMTAGVGVTGTKVAGISSGEAVTGLTNGTTYYFVVTGENLNGESGLSNEASARPVTSETTPPAPGNVVATAADGAVALTWDAVANADSYNVYFSETHGHGTGGIVLTDVDSGVVVEGLTNGTVYYFIVTSVNVAGESSPSIEVSAAPRVDPVPPSAPTGVAAVAADGRATVSWSSTANTDSYNIYYSETSGTGVDGTLVEDATTGEIITGLVNDTTYYFVVTALNIYGASAASEEVSATPTAPTAPPPAPENLAAEAGAASVRLTWDYAATAISYTAYYSETAGTGVAGTAVEDVFPGVEIDGLVNDIPYYFVVSATNGAGESEPSAEVSATPNENDRVSFAVAGGGVEDNEEVASIEAPGGFDPTIFAEYDLTAAWGPVPQPTTKIVFRDGFTDAWDRELEIELYSDQPGTYTIGDGDLRASFDNGTALYHSDGGIFTSGTVVVERNGGGGGKVGGTFDLTLCRVSNCAASTITISGTFVATRDGDLGTALKPATLKVATGQLSRVDASVAASYYRLEPVEIDTTYSFYLWDLSDDADLSLYSDAGFTTPISCDAPNAGLDPEQCVVTATGTALYLRIGYPAAGGGAIYRLTIANFADLTAPEGLTAVGGDGEVYVRWNVDLGVEQYTMVWGTAEDALEQTVTAVSSPWKHTGRVNGTTYFYALRATVLGIGEGPQSDIVGATPGPVQPAVSWRTFSGSVISNSSGGCGASGALSSPIHVVQPNGVVDVNVSVNISHPFVRDVDIFLGYDDGEQQFCVELSTGNGGNGYNYVDTKFDSDVSNPITAAAAPFSGTFTPEGDLELLAGLPMSATWTLWVSDNYAGADVGVLNTWSLEFLYGGDPPPPPAAPAELEAITNDSSLTLVWESVADATSYNLYWGTATGSTPNQIQNVSSPYRHTGLVNDAEYFYVVASVNAGGEGEKSTEATGTPRERHDAIFTDEANVVIPTIDMGDADGCGAPGAIVRSITFENTDFVHDVNVGLDITHGRVGELAVFLGFDNHGEPLCVELTTNNGGAGDDYVGTVLDDEASVPITGGAAPFTGYYRPESPLSLFDNISMDGTWTLYLTDETSGDGGQLNEWFLHLYWGEPLAPPKPTGFVAGPTDGAVVLAWETNRQAESYNLYFSETEGAARSGTMIANVTSPYVHTGLVNHTTYYYVLKAENFVGESAATDEIAATPVPITTYTVTPNANIPDYTGLTNACSASAGLKSVIGVPAGGAVVDVSVEVNITHPWIGDLHIFLGHASGECIALSTANGGGGNNMVHTVFDDDAAIAITAGIPPYTGTYRPEGSLGDFNAIAAGGDWTLYITDGSGGDSGRLDSWSLTLSY